MPRRNLILLFAVGVVSLACYHKVQSNHYGRVLVDAMTLIERYALEPVGEEELYEGAMSGMVGQLDEFSSFISARNVPEFNELVDQKFGGVGIEVLFDPAVGQLMVNFPLIGSPAQKAGIRAGDRILRIDGRSTQGFSVDDAVGLMRGEPGQPVTLSVLHEGESEPVDVEIVRAVIREETALGDRRNADGTWDFLLEGCDGIGYARISSFTEDTGEEVRRMLEQIRPEIRGLVLDLRDDPGGWLESAIKVCDLFVEKGEIVTTRRRDGSTRDRFVAHAQGTYRKLRIAVLINGDSASASEIVAACLQDHGRAVVVGERSFGKGTVQEILELEDGDGILKLTTASYWRPSGRNIHRTRDASDSDDWGVVPDEGYEVAIDRADWVRLRAWRFLRDGHRSAQTDTRAEAADGLPVDALPTDVDPQLAKAVEALDVAPRGKPVATADPTD